LGRGFLRGGRRARGQQVPQPVQLIVAELLARTAGGGFASERTVGAGSLRPGRQLVEQTLAGAAGLDVRGDARFHLRGQFAGQHLAQLLPRRTGAHTASTPSSWAISSCSIFCTLLLALNTEATGMPRRAAASAPDRPSRAVSRNASQVRGSTRSR